MNVVVDACSLINLSNAGALGLVCRLRRCRLWLCPSAAGECGGQCAVQLLSLLDRRDVHRIEDATIPIFRILDLLAKYGLGLGETEAIAACEALGYMLCSDDKPARDLADSMLGGHRVVGSIRLLQWCVEEKLVGCVAAFGLFGVMKESGGFLPKIDRAFFCVNNEDC